MELVEKKVRFDSAREIETALLKHAGRELELIEESDVRGFKTSKKWAIGGHASLGPEKSPSVLTRLRSHRTRVSPVGRVLKKWQRKPKYKSKPKEEEASN